MPLFQFRVTESDDSIITNLVLWIRTESQCLLAVKEMSQKDKKHIHVLIEIKNKSTFIQKFHKKFVTYKGNKSYSCEELREPLDNSLKYLSKGEKYGELPIVLFSKYTELEINEFHNQYWEHPSAQKKMKDETKKSTLTWSQQVKIDYQKEHSEQVNFMKFTDTVNQWLPTDKEKQNMIDAKYHLFCYCMRRLGKSVKVMDESIIKRLFNGVYNSFIQEDAVASERFNKQLFNSIILL